MKINQASLTITFDSDEEARLYAEAARNIVLKGAPNLRHPEVGCTAEQWELALAVAREFSTFTLGGSPESKLLTFVSIVVPQRILIAVLGHVSYWKDRT